MQELNLQHNDDKESTWTSEIMLLIAGTSHVSFREPWLLA